MGNRYNVPVGTKFFRVKVRPLINLKESKEEIREGREKSCMAMSETSRLTILERTLTEAASSSSLPVTPSKQSPVDSDKLQADDLNASVQSAR